MASFVFDERHCSVLTASGATRPLDRTGIEPVNSPLWSAVPTMLTVNQLVTPVNECLSLIAESFVSYCTIVMASALTRTNTGICPFGSHPTACGHPYHGLTLSDVFRSQYLSFTCLLWARHCPLHDGFKSGLGLSKCASYGFFKVFHPSPPIRSLHCSLPIQFSCVSSIPPPQHCGLSHRHGCTVSIPFLLAPLYSAPCFFLQSISPGHH